MTDRARGSGQSQRGPNVHRYRPSPVYHSELGHYRRHVQGLCDRERAAWPAHGPEGSLLQAGYHGSTNQLTAQANSSWLARQPRETNVRSSVNAVNRGKDHDWKYAKECKERKIHLFILSVFIFGFGSCYKESGFVSHIPNSGVFYKQDIFADVGQKLHNNFPAYCKSSGLREN